MNFRLQAGILTDTEKSLLKLEHALEKLLPLKRRKELGMNEA